MLNANTSGSSGVMRAMVLICLVATVGCRRKKPGVEVETGQMKAEWTTPDKPDVGDEELPPTDDKGSRTPPRLSELPTIYFDFDASSIRADQIQNMDKVVKEMRENAAQILVLEGHADERGTTEYNMHLGELRANAVRDYLIRVGEIRADRLRIVSKGEEAPADDGHREDAWAKNRRVEFLYTD